MSDSRVAFVLCMAELLCDCRFPPSIVNALMIVSDLGATPNLYSSIPLNINVYGCH